MTNAIIANGQFIEVSQDCMNILLQVARSMSANVSVPAPTLAPTSTPVEIPSPQPVQPVTPKVYEHVTEGFSDFQFVRKDNTVTVVGKDGKFLYQKAPRTVLNARLKAAGFVYDKDAKVWALTTKGGKRDIKGAEKFVAENSNEVTADELNAIYDEWTNKSAKRASKATK